MGRRKVKPTGHVFELKTFLLGFLDVSLDGNVSRGWTENSEVKQQVKTLIFCHS